MASGKEFAQIFAPLVPDKAPIDMYSQEQVPACVLCALP